MCACGILWVHNQTTVAPQIMWRVDSHLKIITRLLSDGGLLWSWLGSLCLQIHQAMVLAKQTAIYLNRRHLWTPACLVPAFQLRKHCQIITKWTVMFLRRLCSLKRFNRAIISVITDGTCCNAFCLKGMENTRKAKHNI